MMFEPVKFKMTLEYIIDNCEAGGTVHSIGLEGLTEAEMYEYARMAYEANLIRAFIDLSSLSSVGCEMGNPTLKGYELYSMMSNPSRWKKVEEIMREHGVMCLTQMISSMMGKAIDMILT